MSIDWQPAGPPFFDEEGWFLSPVHAATHAIIVQGGMTTPANEAQRMLRDGGVLAERAQEWLDAQKRNCVDCDDEFEPKTERQIRCVPCNVAKHFA